MADSLFYDNFGPFTLGEVVRISKAKLFKDANLDIKIDGVAPLALATEEHLSFFSNSKYLDEFISSKAGVCVTYEKFADLAPEGMIVLISDNPNKSYALVATSFHEVTEVNGKTPIPRSAYISESATIGDNCEIGENVVIENGAIIGSNSKISHNSVIGKGVIIGENAQIGANIVITHAIIGKNVIIHPGVKIGQDGFGFASDASGHTKIPQLGRVLIGNYVEIGANTTIDRGAGPDTIISDMTKIDNLVQIGHNAKLGKACLVVSQVGIAGSTEIGDFVVLGGQVGIAGHLKIGNYVQIAAQSGIVADISAKQIVGGTPAVPIRDWHRQSIMLKNLGKKNNKNG